MIDKRYIVRIAVVIAAVFLSLAGLGTRLAFLHLGPNDEFRQRVLRARHVEKEIVVSRGRILDRHGNILAMDLAVKNIFADPKVILEKNQVRFIASHLSRLLQLDPAIVLDKVSRPGRRFEYVKKCVFEDKAEEVRQLGLPGIHFEEASHRYYPHNHQMCHVVGFSNAQRVGSAGIEQQMNKYLKGRPGLRIGEKDGRRREVYNRRNLEIEPQEGADVYLTLDHNIQGIVEEALDSAMVKHSAKAAWAIVQRIQTGEILAMASRPAYSLNNYGKTPQEFMRNRPISYVYEPGSTFKVAVIAAALNEGIVHPSDVIDCENGVWYYKGRPLRDFHGYDKLSVADVLQKSSNIGAAKIALTLGDQKLEDYLRKFGVGKQTGIDLPGEEGGIFHSRDRWSAISATRIAMGHEVAVSALQMLNIVCAIANDGFLMKPMVISKVVNAKGMSMYEMEPEVLSRPISEDTAATMRGLLTRVTEEGGTGRRAVIEGYKVAGKTGTAQKPVAGGYSDSANIASFVGFLPAELPEVGIIVVVDEPQPLHTGGSVSAPVFREIAEELVHYLEIPPVHTDVALSENSLRAGNHSTGRREL
ncbi:MAG: penicillin-binding protein 2 [Verrucomicrobia bacterium]|nr:penicillin-binding protein 2 [Verrucomicrobiota bacterium]